MYFFSADDNEDNGFRIQVDQDCHIRLRLLSVRKFAKGSFTPIQFIQQRLFWSRCLLVELEFRRVVFWSSCCWFDLPNTKSNKCSIWYLELIVVWSSWNLVELLFGPLVVLSTCRLVELVLVDRSVVELSVVELSDYQQRWQCLNRVNTFSHFAPIKVSIKCWHASNRCLTPARTHFIQNKLLH
jgi:hypothetical protein